MTTCCLCCNLRTGSLAEIWDQPLFESTNFVVIPTLGALISGWVLLVPKRHHISMGALPPSSRAEMQEVKEAVYALMRRAYGDVCAFEHGPSSAKREVGCGVDHAHLHILPLQFDLRSVVAPFLPDGLSWTSANLDGCRAAFEQGQDYLYLEQPAGNGQIVVHDNFGSQLFRRAIATRLGTAHEFNWRDFPHVKNIMSTIGTLTTVAAGGAVPQPEIVHAA